jgi:hypothetical protein
MDWMRVALAVCWVVADAAAWVLGVALLVYGVARARPPRPTRDAWSDPRE